jgi:hypothetical protein
MSYILNPSKELLQHALVANAYASIVRVIQEGYYIDKANAELVAR